MNPSLSSLLFQEELYHIPPRTAVVLARKWEAYSAEEKALLVKILSSVNLDLSSVIILSQPLFSLSSLSPEVCEKALVFAPSADDIQPYQCVQAQGFSLIASDDLSGLDEMKKKSLWLALKNMFSIGV